MLSSILKKALLIIVAVYAIMCIYYILGIGIGDGDEIIFMKDIEFVKANGWIEAVKKNISIPHMLLVYPLTLVFENHIALRVLNVILLIGLYVYFKIRNKETLLFFVYFTFYIATSKSFLMGTNDTVFHLALIIFFNEVYKLSKSKIWYGSLAICALIVAIFTRVVFIVYSPVIILGLYIIYKQKGWRSVKSIYPTILIVVLLSINLPSLLENNNLSYDKKAPPENLNVSWAQRQYLAQLLVNDGKLQNYQHPSFQATHDYLLKHGKKSLPNSTFQSIIFDYRLTIKEFFKDLYHILFYGFRQLGFMLFIPILYLFYKLYKKHYSVQQLFVPISLMAMIFVFALIIISYIELRWFIPIFTLSIIYFVDLEKNKIIPKKIIMLNHFVLIGMSLYGMYRLLPNFI